MQKTKPNRDLSNWVWNCIHIDDMTKAILVVRVRGLEDIIALSDAPQAGTLLGGLKDVLDQVDDARENLHDLCQISEVQVLADLYHALTRVADDIYRLAYQKERD